MLTLRPSRMAKTAVAPQNCLLCCQIDGFLGTSPDIVCTDLQDTTLLHLMPVLIVQILTEIQSLSFSIKPPELHICMPRCCLVSYCFVSCCILKQPAPCLTAAAQLLSGQTLFGQLLEHSVTISRLLHIAFRLSCWLMYAHS